VSRSTRPLRRVGADERALLAVRLAGERGGELLQWLRMWPAAMARSLWLSRLASRLACRPAQLRRCLLGRRVSARAAGRILGS
jgi:hypothetical protein